MSKIKEAFNDLDIRDSKKIAVLDIGSNSFHLVVARIISGTVQIVHKMKQKVRLAEGLDKNNYLSEEAIERGLQALSVIKASLQGFEPKSVRIVATFTLRQAKNANHFIEKAKSVFPFPVEIIAGQEEARLIYNGVAHTNNLEGRNLVIDIGGGSTEFIIGEKFQPIILRSLDMGCVSFTKRFFQSGKIKKKQFEKAITTAQQQLELIVDKYQTIGWNTKIGTSGTIESLAVLCKQSENLQIGPITLAQLEEKRQYCINAGHVNDLQLGEVNEDRKQVFPAGLAILIAIFRSLEITELNYVNSALREGVIYEMETSLTHDDVREHSAQSLATRYDVDIEHAKLVLKTALTLFRQAKVNWQLDNKRLKPILSWAAMLHEIGIHIHSRGVQRHSAYILKNADLHGFNYEQQNLLACLARFHRKKIKPEEVPKFTQFTQFEVFQLIVILRLAVLLNVKRQKNCLPDIRLDASKASLTLIFPKNWLSAQPVLLADLQREQSQIKKLDIQFNFNS